MKVAVTSRRRLPLENESVRQLATTRPVHVLVENLHQRAPGIRVLQESRLAANPQVQTLSLPAYLKGMLHGGGELFS